MSVCMAVRTYMSWEENKVSGEPGRVSKREKYDGMDTWFIEENSFIMKECILQVSEICGREKHRETWNKVKKGDLKKLSVTQKVIKNCTGQWYAVQHLPTLNKGANNDDNTHPSKHKCMHIHTIISLCWTVNPNICFILSFLYHSHSFFLFSTLSVKEHMLEMSVKDFSILSNLHTCLFFHHLSLPFVFSKSHLKSYA